jgi:hypothetical protein
MMNRNVMTVVITVRTVYYGDKNDSNSIDSGAEKSDIDYGGTYPDSEIYALIDEFYDVQDSDNDVDNESYHDSDNGEGGEYIRDYDCDKDFENDNGSDNEGQMSLRCN